MTTTEKGFIVEVYNDITNKLKSNWNRISWYKFPVELVFVETDMITKVGETEFKDTCPMKGRGRNRTEIAEIVCSHICEAFGGNMDEVREAAAALYAELFM